MVEDLLSYNIGIWTTLCQYNANIFCSGIYSATSTDAGSTGLQHKAQVQSPYSHQGSLDYLKAVCVRATDIWESKL